MDLKTLILGAVASVTLTSGMGGAGAVWEASRAWAASGPDVLGVMTALCAVKPTDIDGLRQALPDGRVLEARIDGPAGRPARSLHRVLMPDGGEWVISRIFPGGRLRRISLEWHEADAGGARDAASRPLLAVVAGGDCRPIEGRRLVYGANGHAETLEILSADLETVVLREPLDPPVPELNAPPADAVPVAVVDTGVNYTLPMYRGRLARSNAGALVGYDFWDMDARPFDIDAARSLFFPLHHGTAVSSIILREAPKAVILPYRYPRPDMARFSDLIARADAADDREHQTRGDDTGEQHAPGELDDRDRPRRRWGRELLRHGYRVATTCATRSADRPGSPAVTCDETAKSSIWCR